MLGFKDISEVRSKIEKSQNEYAKASDSLLKECEILNDFRFKRGSVVIGEFEDFINGMKNTPADYGRSALLYRLNQTEVMSAGEHNLKAIDKALKEAAVQGGATAGVGVAAGAATAFGAPSAAMAIATTFGTASTGTAISSLSGAAASKAALAWLGGGALSAGGGGTAAGTALIALSGPVGWALCGTAVVAGAGWAYWKNNDTMEKAVKFHKEVSDALNATRKSVSEVRTLAGVTKKHIEHLEAMVQTLLNFNITDFRLMTQSQVDMAAACHNNVLALARLIKKAPGELLDVNAPSMTSVERSYLETAPSVCRDFILVDDPRYRLEELEVLGGKLVRKLPHLGAAGVIDYSHLGMGIAGGAIGTVVGAAANAAEAGIDAVKSFKDKIFK